MQPRLTPFRRYYVNPSLDSLEGVIEGTIVGVIKGDTRSLDYIMSEFEAHALAS